MKGAMALSAFRAGVGGKPKWATFRGCGTAGNFGFRGPIGLSWLECQVKHALTPQVLLFLVFTS
jgi:hypothetical protein